MSKAPKKSPNESRRGAKAAPKQTDAKSVKRPKTASKSRKTAKPKLLSGGNPQFAKAYGDAPVQAYIAAMPGWKSEVGRRLDALITRAVPNVHKAIKWNSPLYGIDPEKGGEDWFLGIHCYTKFIKIASSAVRF